MVQQEFRKNKHWTDEEKNFVYDSWGEMPVNRIANKLGRTTTSIRRFAERNSLGGAIHNDLYLTTGQCADIIKVDPTTIYSWIETKQLKVSKQKIGKRKIHLVDPQDYREFLKNNQDRWNATRLQIGFFDNNLDWLIKKLERDSEPVKQKSKTLWTIKEELQLLDLVSQGYMNKEICKILNRSYVSVRNKRVRLTSKS